MHCFLKKMARPVRFERTTYSLEGRGSGFLYLFISFYSFRFPLTNKGFIINKGYFMFYKI